MKVKSYKEYFNSKRMLDDYNNLYQKIDITRDSIKI